MTSLSDILNKTPWWALLITGLGSAIALAVFVTPYHIIDYRNEGATPGERRAIKREIDNALAENAIGIAHNVLQGMKRSTKDPERREELEVALAGLEEARQELRDAGSEVLRSKREVLETARDAARTARDAIREARRKADDAIAQGGTEESERVKKALDESLKAAEDAEAQATKSLEESRRKRATIAAGVGKPVIDIEVDGQRIVVPKPPKSSEKLAERSDIPPIPPVPSIGAIPPVPPVPPVDPAPPLPPEVRDQIRQNVIGDMYRIGIGAALALILIPMFILAIIAKFFIDRSRAAIRMAELKRKEADFARMTQQVTEAKLQALQAQVEPHFLYNTLASVQALTEVDPAKANEMTGHLIQYLRNALPKMREGVSTVGQEVELVRAYLSILQMRMGKRLTFDIAVPASLSGLAFPPLMLPSLVENAIKHGLEPQREGGSVHISATQADGKLRVGVADTGRGFGEAIGAGVGLANIRERLAALYGGAAKLTLEENAPHGVIATIEVPSDGARVAATTANGSPGAAFSTTAPAAAAEAATGAAGGAAAAAAAPRSRTARVLSAAATVERAWRKGLSFTFLVLVVVAAVVAGLAIFGIVTEMLPMEIEGEVLVGPGGALVGTAGILLGFFVVVIALALVVAVIYGLGFLLVGLAIFIPVMILIASSPFLAPIVLAGLLIWWILRRKDKAEQAKAAAKVEPTMAEAAPPMPPADRPL